MLLERFAPFCGLRAHEATYRSADLSSFSRDVHRPQHGWPQRTWGWLVDAEGLLLLSSGRGHGPSPVPLYSNMCGFMFGAARLFGSRFFLSGFFGSGFWFAFWLLAHALRRITSRRWLEILSERSSRLARGCRPPMPPRPWIRPGFAWPPTCLRTSGHAFGSKA